ncbi:MAG: hypothetical protein OEY48_07085 [Gammaproteobacteria bacterium]|nr:hypothetical protein [Gammaproteobacteria bacterium]MDH5592596.1 hypothetical protein [Gammaproteobacteria bacterium]
MSDSKHSLMAEEGHWHHTGKDDRRKGERRSGKDQREMLRFELDKEDRRSGKDRRGSATSWGSDDPI